jgi:hypothetical protein
MKPNTNVYTMMLILSFIFLTTASVIMAMELSRFGNTLTPWDTRSAQPAVK